MLVEESKNGNGVLRYMVWKIKLEKIMFLMVIRKKKKRKEKIVNFLVFIMYVFLESNLVLK